MQEHDPFTWRDAAVWLWGALVTVLAGSSARTNTRLSKLEEALTAKATSATVDQRFRDEKADHAKESDRLERAFSDHREEARDHFKAVNARLDTIIERMMR